MKTDPLFSGGTVDHANLKIFYFKSPLLPPPSLSQAGRCEDRTGGQAGPTCIIQRRQERTQQMRMFSGLICPNKN